ncbi:hypothetical protein [Luteibacter aegosomatissinici]|uniref:hypothetical protein n=1 Tax=Luteibacter aegosomatissinici TaxID=2911539 RepID=UPI001FF7112B|nr:hypothetical protein [Luteibacter aegosomatissinici]UPG94936.1 hypothetical protein L2Y97_02175 [Luteibacter aegosomatissinici]
MASSRSASVRARASVTIAFLGVMLVACPTWASPPQPANRFHLAPRAGDAYQAWTRAALHQLTETPSASFEPFMPDPQWVAALLDEPASPYSDLRPAVFSSDVIRGLPGSMQKRRAIAWDLGLDKALTGYQARAQRFSADVETQWPAVRPHIIKAGVKPYYLHRAHEHGGGASYPALTAELAVAAQTLRDWVDSTPESLRDAVGVRIDVLRRFEATGDREPLSADDLAYLADILRGELSMFRAGNVNIFGQRELPAPLRIARAAAASWLAVRTSAAPECHEDGSVNRSHAASRPEDPARPMCFSDATDRAVYAWYLAERNRELAATLDTCEGGPVLCERLRRAFASVAPTWMGAFPRAVMRYANHAEVAELLMAQDVDAGAPGDTAYLHLLQRAHLLVYPGDRP